MHNLKKQHYIFFVWIIFLQLSCQNELQKKEVIQTQQIVFYDFIDFPQHPFVQINFQSSLKENQSILINSGFTTFDNEKYERKIDSTIVFLNDGFKDFTLYFKSQKYLKNYELLFNLIKSKSSQCLGSKSFAEFYFQLISVNYSIVIFKTNQFIRLKYTELK